MRLFAIWPPDTRTLRLSFVVKFLICGFVLLSSTKRCAAENFTIEHPTIRKLASELTCIMDGRTFRDSIDRIAETAHLQVWISRDVDPGQIVNSGTLGPTVHSAIKKLVEDHGCVFMPSGAIVLVGKPDWVEQATGALTLIQSKSRQTQREIFASEQARIQLSETADVEWPDLTTPEQAVRVLGIACNPALPHDLWPACQLEEVTRAEAASLILSQFGREPSKFEYLDGHALVIHKPIESAPQLAHRYGGLAVRGDIEKHSAALAVFVNRWANKAKKEAKDEPKFSLKTEAQAGSIFKQLAVAGSLICQIDPAAKEPCKTIVRIESKDTTIRELIELIATQAKVQLVWAGSQFTVVKN